MNLVEAGRLLAKVSGNDGREVGEVTVLAWQETLADVPYVDAMAAVTEHYRRSTDFLMPAHIITLADEARRARLQQRRDERHDQRVEALADLPAATRKAVAQAIGHRTHNVTLRRVDLNGTRWAYSCTCGVNPIGQEWPDKDTARTESRRHMPKAAAVG